MATPTAGAREPFDFGRGLRFVVDDPDWVKKILIGGVFTLLSAILIGGPFVIGYWMRLMARAARGEPRPLPEWDDLGGMFSEGLKGFVLYLGHLAVILIPVGAVLAAVIVLGSLSAASGERASDAAGAMAGLGMAGVYVITLPLALALTLYLPSAMLRLALGASLGQAFDPRENVGLIRRNLGNYALALVLYLVAHFVSQFGVILCCVGVFPLSFWSICILGWGMGEVARRDPVLSGSAPPLLPSV